MKNRPEVLIIDDEPQIRELLIDVVSEEYTPLIAANGNEGLAMAVARQPDIILLDILMPDLDGISVCKKLRDNPSTCNIPVIMLTATRSADHRISAFDSGADDFISKPFEPDELIARIRSKIRRYSQFKSLQSGEKETNLHFGNLSINLDKLEVQVSNEKVKLSALEFKLLKLLVENSQRITSRKEILQSVWGPLKTSNRAIDAHIVSIRKKLKNFDQKIESIYGVGYTIKAR